MTSLSRLAGFTAEPSGHYTTRRPLTPEQIIRAGRILAKRHYLKKCSSTIVNPDIAEDVFRGDIEGEEREVFSVLFLNNKNHIISLERMFYGTINSAKIHPREVAKRALELNAAAVIVAHNHPSGDPKPSAQDFLITHKLKEALSTVEVRLLDHLVIGAGDSWSIIGFNAV